MNIRSCLPPPPAYDEPNAAGGKVAKTLSAVMTSWTHRALSPTSDFFGNDEKLDNFAKETFNPM